MTSSNFNKLLCVYAKQVDKPQKRFFLLIHVKSIQLATEAFSTLFN